MEGGWSPIALNEGCSLGVSLAAKSEVLPALMKNLFIFRGPDEREIATLRRMLGLSIELEEEDEEVSEKEASDLLKKIARSHRFTCLFDCIESLRDALSEQERSVGSASEHVLNLALRSDEYMVLRMHFAGKGHIKASEVAHFFTKFRIQLDIRRPVNIGLDSRGDDARTYDVDATWPPSFRIRLYPKTVPDGENFVRLAPMVYLGFMGGGVLSVLLGLRFGYATLLTWFGSKLTPGIQSTCDNVQAWLIRNERSLSYFGLATGVFCLLLNVFT